MLNVTGMGRQAVDGPATASTSGHNVYKRTASMSYKTSLV